jgi:hypothetical protein
MSEQDVRAVHAAGESAAYARREHYRHNVAGQGVQAGDPQPSVSTLTPVETNMRDGDESKGQAGSL